MTEISEGPPPGQEDGPGRICFTEQHPDSPQPPQRQDISRVVQFPVRPTPPPRQPRLEARLSVRDGLEPVGRSRRFFLTWDEILELIARLEAMEARG
jgi:hypothetical protein